MLASSVSLTLSKLAAWTHGVLELLNQTPDAGAAESVESIAARAENRCTRSRENTDHNLPGAEQQACAYRLSFRPEISQDVQPRGSVALLEAATRQDVPSTQEGR